MSPAPEPRAGVGWALAGGRGCSWLFPEALEGCSEPVWPPCPALLLPLAVGTLPTPKTSAENAFFQGVLTAPRVLRALPTAPSQPGLALPPAQEGAEPRMAETGPKLCHSPVWEAPGSHPHGHTADGKAVPALGGFPWLPARACPGRSRSPPPAEQSQTPAYSK